jgi:hypothetical protein
MVLFQLCCSACSCHLCHTCVPAHISCLHLYLTPTSHLQVEKPPEEWLYLGGGWPGQEGGGSTSSSRALEGGQDGRGYLGSQQVAGPSTRGSGGPGPGPGLHSRAAAPGRPTSSSRGAGGASSAQRVGASRSTAAGRGGGSSAAARATGGGGAAGGVGASGATGGGGGGLRAQLAQLRQQYFGDDDVGDEGVGYHEQGGAGSYYAEDDRLVAGVQGMGLGAGR